MHAKSKTLNTVFRTVDSFLSCNGMQQATDLSRFVGSLGVQTVVVSPMIRAMQTAQGMFGGIVACEDHLVNPLFAEVVCCSFDVGRPICE